MPKEKTKSRIKQIVLQSFIVLVSIVPSCFRSLLYWLFVALKRLCNRTIPFVEHKNCKKLQAKQKIKLYRI